MGAKVTKPKSIADTKKSVKSEMTDHQTSLLRQFGTLAAAMSDAGMNVTAVIATYSETDAQFHTYILTDPSEPSDEWYPSHDHIMMDAIRELGFEWSCLAHHAHETRVSRGDK